MPQLALVSSTPTAARWIARVLVPAYGRSCWVRRPLRARSLASTLEWGRRVRPWPEELRGPSDGPSAIAHLALAMTGIPDGVSVHWRFIPSPATWNRRALAETGRDALATPEARLPASRFRSSTPSGRPPVYGPAPVFWKASVAIEFPDSVDSDRTVKRSIQTAVEGALRSCHGNGVRFGPRWFDFVSGEPWFPVTEEELAYVLPCEDADAGLLPERVADEGSILPIGRSADGQVVGPPIEDGQGRHMAILGETGMGKSATLVAIARKATSLGGVVLLDPLGETARSFVEELPPDDRLGRLILVSPRTATVGINALEGVGGGAGDPVLSDRRLNDLVHALRRVRSGRYDAKFWGPRLEEVLSRALGAAAGFPSGTLADAHTLLATGGRTRQVVPPEAQESVRELADRVRERPEDAEGARRLLYEVVRSPVLRSLLCEPNPHLHVSELVAPGRIAVVSGDASFVGESTARYLLAVYLALIWSELLARSSHAKTFVLLDEAQWFSHDSLSEMLRLARRRNVHVVLATQTIGSLPEGVDEAVWTNVSDFVAFRGSPDEARELERATPGLAMEEILALPRGHAAVLLGKGNSVAWLRTAGRPPGLSQLEVDSGGEPAAAVASVAKPESPVVPSAPTVVSVLEWIRARARSNPASPTVRVDLAELRRSVDPSGRAVREAGALLGRTGALVTTKRGDEGPAWMVDPSKIPANPAATKGSPGSDTAEAPQPS